MSNYSSTIDSLRAGDLTPEHDAQRLAKNISQKNIDQIATNFDSAKLGVPLINIVPTDGLSAEDLVEMYGVTLEVAQHHKLLGAALKLVIDGGHRVRGAVQSAKAGPDYAIRCEVFHGLTAEEMHCLFLARSTATVIKTADRFSNEVGAGVEMAASINDMVKALGLSVGQDSTTQVSCVTALRTVYRSAGPVTLARALSILHGAYDLAGLTGHAIKGMAAVLDLFDGTGKTVTLEDDLAVKALANTSNGYRGFSNRAEARMGRATSAALFTSAYALEIAAVIKTEQPRIPADLVKAKATKAENIAKAVKVARAEKRAATKLAQEADAA